MYGEYIGILKNFQFFFHYTVLYENISMYKCYSSLHIILVTGN